MRGEYRTPGPRDGGRYTRSGRRCEALLAPESPPAAFVMGGMDLLRPLGLAGVPLVVVAPRGAATRFSRFTRAVLNWSDPWERPQELLDTLLRFGSMHPKPPVLFYDEDGPLLFVSRHRRALAGTFRFSLPDETLVEDLADKARFQVLAERIGLPVPAARCLRPREGPCPHDIGLRFPIVIKPLMHRAGGLKRVGRSQKAVQIDTPAALREVWPRLAEANLPVLAQELIPGMETFVESYHVYVDEAGVVAGEFTGRKIRTWPHAFGDSTALVITDATDVMALGRELVRRLNLRGVAKLDFKRAPDGSLYLLEVNPRFNLWHHPAALAGVNLPLLAYRDLIGVPREPAPCARPGVSWCRIWRDVLSARYSGMPLAAWVSWTIGCDAKSCVAWDDPLPLVGAALWRCRSLLA